MVATLGAAALVTFIYKHKKQIYFILHSTIYKSKWRVKTKKTVNVYAHHVHVFQETNLLFFLPELAERYQNS